MKQSIIFILMITAAFRLQAQFTESNLPIVIIQTNNGFEIPDQPRSAASMKVIYNGPGKRNFVADAADPAKLNYNGSIRIEIRGSSSQSLPKKQYGFSTVLSDNSTNNNVSLLGLPPENDWVLNGLAFDASLIRDYLSFRLSEAMGNYAPRQQYCEVMINGDYKGLYLLQEKIKIDDNRVDIRKISRTDNTQPDISGGYLIKADKVTWEDPSAWIMISNIGTPTDFIHESPDPVEITTAQHSYIKTVFTKLEVTASNASITKGYPAVIDVPSFVDFMLINELAANVDAYQFSTYFHKDKNAKLRAGPLWDLNLTYGNDLWFWGLDRSKTDTWQFANWDNVGARFWFDLFNNATFRCYLARRWNELTNAGAVLNKNSVNAFIDETVANISEAAARENQRWGTVGNHAFEIAKIKEFISIRIPWMTSQLGTFGPCASVTTPPLQITRINYHPGTSAAFPDDDDQEFIEIINTGADPVALTGLYFRGTGFVYHFPEGAVLPGNAVIQLANNREVFKARYGYLPYDQFTRNLSNASQKLIVADAFGNVIDEVEYTDSAPWPAADGNGMYLKLISTELDNNDGSHWTATDEAISATESAIVGIESASTTLRLYPNPTDGSVRIYSAAAVAQIALMDLQGQRIADFKLMAREATLNLDGLAPGLYIFSIEFADGKREIQKLLKN